MHILHVFVLQPYQNTFTPDVDLIVVCPADESKLIAGANVVASTFAVCFIEVAFKSN